MKTLEQLAESETHESQPSSPPRLEAPLFLYPRLPGNLSAIAIFAFTSAYLAITNASQGLAQVLALASLMGFAGIAYQVFNLLRSRICLTRTHLDIIQGANREIVRWEDITEIREVLVPKRWFYRSQSDAYIVKTHKGSYHLPKSVWPDGEWLILHYRNQTGREIRQVNYW